MKVSNSLVTMTTRALAESLDVTMMTHLARDMIDTYDLHQRTGFRESMAIPNRDAARQIVTDMVQAGLYFVFISLLINVHTIGYKGRKYPISYLKEIVKEIHDSGYIYDQENRIFIEDPDVRRTRNWGALIEGNEYFMAFLRLDIVKNSELVRKYPDDVIKATYGDLRKIVENAIEPRNGRIWNWEGDGGMVAFYFSNKSLLATLSAMEIINELAIYNYTKCRLDEPLRVRIAVHSGLCEYTQDLEELMKNDVVKECVQIESKYTKPASATISNIVCSHLETSLLKGFTSIPIENRIKYCNYSINLE